MQAILFDFNGVIIDDEEIQREAYSEVFKEKGIELTKDDYYACLGMNDVRFVATNFAKKGVEIGDDLVAEIIKKKSEAWQRKVEKSMPLFEGIEDTVHRLARRFSVGLVSMARKSEIDFVLERTGLDKCFSIIVSAGDVSTTKPDPECYRLGFKLIDGVATISGRGPLNKSQCLVVEDTPQGIQAAVGAGLRTLGVSNTVSADHLRDAGAEAVAKDLSDLNSGAVLGLYSRAARC